MKDKKCGDTVEDPHKPEKIDVILNDYSVEEPVIISRATVVDNFWVEIAEHFKAIAKLCEERSKNG